MTLRGRWVATIWVQSLPASTGFCCAIQRFLEWCSIVHAFVGGVGMDAVHCTDSCIGYTRTCTHVYWLSVSAHYDVSHAHKLFAIFAAILNIYRQVHQFTLNAHFLCNNNNIAAVNYFTTPLLCSTCGYAVLLLPGTICC